LYNTSTFPHFPLLDWYSQVIRTAAHANDTYNQCM
jgi:hypothetical protein